MMKGYSGWRLGRIAPVLLGGFLALGQAPLQAAESQGGKELVAERCTICHLPLADGGLARIAETRRSPEGWDMTVVRMTLIHGTKLTAAERRTMVKYLADSAGLAPQEAQPWRYVLERRPEAVDREEDTLVTETCARCHSYARIGLQRRTEAEWLKLVHFHVGQFPTIELQSNLRAVYWWQIASEQIPPLLAKRFPLESAAWKAWQQRPKTNPAGTWRVVGHRPGWGDYEGVATVTAKQADEYALTLELHYANGKTQKGSGEAIVYTGYEWRGSVIQGDEEVRQVFALSEDGRHLQGRWHLTGTDALGGDLRGTKIDGAAEILAVAPGHLKAGAKQQLTIHGASLSGEVSIDGGVTVTRVVSRAPDKVVVEVQAAASAADGLRTVQVGAASGAGLLNVYRKIAALRIQPDPGLARVGGNGGKLAPVPIQFEAIAYAAGKDGKAGTPDDVRIGVLPARWQVANRNAAAVAMQDARYAGSIDADSGLFAPGPAGPNPKRKFGTNNAGELKVTATVADGNRTVKGSAPFIVTVQRWVDPPIR